MNSSSAVPDEGVGDGCPACGGQVVLKPSTTAEHPCPHCGHRLWFLRKCVGDVVVITFLPGLTHRFESLQQVDEVTKAVGRPRRLLLNLSHLRFVPSVFLGMLVELHRRMASSPSVEVFGVEPESLRVFTATRLDELFRIYDDEQSAFASLRPHPSRRFHPPIGKGLES